MPLSPASGPGGGGGTPSLPFVLSGGSPTDAPVYTFASDGSVTFDDTAATTFGGSLALSRSGKDAAGVRFSAGGGVTARGDGAGIFLSNLARSVYWLDVADGLFAFSCDAEPPDNYFDNNGQCALWLDPTPGATVFHIKALDSGGTARRASIALA